MLNHTLSLFLVVAWVTTAIALSLPARDRIDVDQLRMGEAHLPPAPCSSRASARTFGLRCSEIAARAGFPDLANKFPDGPN